MENSNQYFNFTADAVAYINEIKIVAPKKGDKFCALKVCILEGNSDKPDKIYADLIVRGDQARKVLWSLKDRWPQGFNTSSERWFASIRIGSLGIKTYEKKDKSTGVLLSGRLIGFTYLKVGEDVIDLSLFGNNKEAA